MITFRIKSEENIETAPHIATQVYNVGDWLTPNGTGALIPATPTDPISGLCGQSIQVGDPEYITALAQIHFDQAIQPTDRFLMPVTAGIALASMIGSPFDLDTSTSLDVSGPGTTFEITQVYSTTLVEVKVLLYA